MLTYKYGSRIDDRKRIARTAVSLLAVLVMIFFVVAMFSPQVKANDDDEAISSDDQFQNVSDVIKEGMNASNMFNEMMKLTKVSWMVSIFSGESGLLSSLSSSLDIVTAAISGIVMAAIAITTIVAILKEASQGDLSLAMWGKIAVKAMLGIAVAAQTTHVINFINSFGQSLFPLIKDALNNLPYDTAETFDLENLESLSNTGIFLMSGFINLYAQFYVYQLLIELLIRKMVAPLGAVWIINEGIRGPGLRFFKGYLVVYLKILTYVICLTLAQYLIVEGILVNSGLSGKTIVIGAAAAIDIGLVISACTAMAKDVSGALAKEALGM